MHHAGELHHGVVTKPYGLEGAVHLMVDPALADGIKIGNPLFIEIDGQRIPFFIEEIVSGTGNHFIIKLEFINSLMEARQYCGMKIYPEETVNKPVSGDDLKILVGYSVSDPNRDFEGEVMDVLEHSINRILVVDFRGKEVMVPYADEILRNVDHRSRSIEVNLPDGLIEVNMM